MQLKHREDDARLALAHAELSSGTGIALVMYYTRRILSYCSTLKTSHSSLRVYMHLPFAPDLFELTLELLGGGSGGGRGRCQGARMHAL